MIDHKEWRAVPNWPEYECSSEGDVRRVSAACGTRIGKPLKWTLMNTGYAKVALCRNSKKQEFLIHRLVAITFIGEIEKGMDVCHFDGDKLNNSLSNLRIDTRKGNMADTVRLGRSPRGIRCGSNKHPPELILLLRELSKSGMRNSDISRKLGVTPQYVTNVLKGRIWSWL